MEIINMKAFDKYNKGRKFNFVTPSNFTFKSIADLFNNNGGDYIYHVNAFFFSRGKYGESACVVTDNEIIALPKHKLDDVHEMYCDDEIINLVNEGHMGFKIYPYNPKGREEVCYSVTWCDFE